MAARDAGKSGNVSCTIVGPPWSSLRKTITSPPTPYPMGLLITLLRVERERYGPLRDCIVTLEGGRGEHIHSHMLMHTKITRPSVRMRDGFAK